MAKQFVNNVNEKNLILIRAQQANLARDFATAARLYKTLLKDDPSNVDYLKEIGSIYVKGGEDEKAIPYYEQIITFYPHYIDAMTALGAIYRRLHRYEDSIEILTRALDEGRQTGVVNYNLGFTYKEMGNFDDAIEAFQIVISQNPSDVLAYNHIGNIYLEKKQYEKAIASFKRGLQVDQNHPILNYNLARCYSEAEVYGDAIRCYELALRSKPGWIDAIKDFSTLLINCQKSEEASELVKNAINVHPNNTKLLCSLGKIYLNEFDYDSAEKTYSKAEKIDGKDLEILQGLFEAYDKNGKSEEALDTVIKAKNINPDDENVKKQYVSALLSAGEIEAAGTTIKEMYEEKGESDPEVLDLYGQYYICAGEDEKAQSCFEKIKSVNRNYKKHKLAAAGRYAQVGKTEQAEAQVKEFIAQDIKNPAGYNTLGKIYEKAGNVQGAIDAFGKSKSLKKPNVQADKEIAGLLNGTAGIRVMDDISGEADYEKNLDSILEQQEQEIKEKTIGAEARAIVEEPDEEFDFAQMGGNVPMGEALVEKEKDFFDEIDEATGEPYKSEEEKEAEEIEQKIQALNKNPYADLEDDGPSPFDALNSLEADESRTDKNALLGNTMAKDIPSGERDQMDYDDFNSPEFLMPKQEEPEEEISEDNSVDDIFAGSNYGSGNKNIESNAERIERPYYPEEPVQNSYPNFDPAYAESRLNDMVNNAAAQNRMYLENEQSRFEAQMAEEQRNFALQMAAAQRKQAEEQELALEQMREEISNKLESSSLAKENDEESEGPEENLISESDGTEETVSNEEFAEETDETEVTDEIETGTDFSYSSDISYEDEKEIDPDFLFDSLNDFDEEESQTDAENEIETGTEIESESEPENTLSVHQLMPAIEKILYDEDYAEENADKLELFKKLLSLSEYLPEGEKEKFRSGKIRMQMEFLISKMSGRPGLLKTSSSLLKTGVTGDGLPALSELSMEDISNDKIKKLMKKMQDLSGSLEDQELAKSLCDSADGILEKIQQAEKDNQIFR